jgi:hypothetical protein
MAKCRQLLVQKTRDGSPKLRAPRAVAGFGGVFEDGSPKRCVPHELLLVLRPIASLDSVSSISTIEGIVMPRRITVELRWRDSIVEISSAVGLFARFLLRAAAWRCGFEGDGILCGWCWC